MNKKPYFEVRFPFQPLKFAAVAHLSSNIEPIKTDTLIVSR